MKVRPIKVTPEISAFRYKPEDFYGEYEDSLWLCEARIADATRLAWRLNETGATKASLLLICKIATGYRQYVEKCQKYKR